MNVVHIIECWRRKFFDYYRSLDINMTLYKIDHKYKERSNLLIITQALVCLDEFCTNISVDKGFEVLYNQCQVDIARESKDAYTTVVDYIRKENYVNADLALRDIVNNMLDSKYSIQIKHELRYSLNQVMKDTEFCIQRLEVDANYWQISENIEKIRFVMNSHRMNELIEKETKIAVENFEKKVDELLYNTISQRIENTTIFIDHSNFLEAEWSMEKLILLYKGLANFFKSTSVDAKMNELQMRLSNPVDDILQHYDLEDITKYSRHPPTYLLDELKKAASGGYAKYAHAYKILIGKLQEIFSIAIDKVRDSSFNGRSVKYAFRFLPEELKTIFQSDVDELNMNTNA